MERLKELQLGLWRGACRHIDLAESISDLASVIGEFVPIDAMLAFALEGHRCKLVAAMGAPQGLDAIEIEGDDATSIARFVERGGLCLLNPSRAGRSLLRPLAPHLGFEPVVCGAVQRAGVSEGVVVWRLQRGRELDDRAATLLAASLEPLAVAMDTSRRFHELEELRRAAEADRLTALRRLGRHSLDEPMVGADGGLSPVLERVSLVAESDVPVLILGETGSGKEVIARAIHAQCRRHEGPFLRVNCGAIPPELIDSQLFGHERGAFTGATERRQGWFERADGGTLFLDEIGELPLAAQVRLLRVLQDGTLERVGGQKPIHVDCRIIAATHRDLAQMVRDRAFREDLWYRLAVFPLMLPPLRERQQDLPSLVNHFAQRASVRFGLPAFTVTESDLELLRGYAWPGNIRELASVIDRAALLGQSPRLALAAALGGIDPPRSLATTAMAQALVREIVPLDDAIRNAVESALTTAGGKVEGPRGAAALLKINASTLRSKIRKLGIDPRRFREAPVS